ncbi:AAA domain-containing protein [Algoriphagus aquaeductus]|uniref:AAA domain-containing protein n=2 Tax=Algoriphagus aquaeductus TaxID=475299 RepID=A0A326RMT9_9BACT|nr:AAA domain-containing protein [Algoriphagus aquaeductus]
MYFQFEGVTKEILDFFNVKVKKEDSTDIEIHYPYLDGSIKVCKPFLKNKWSYLSEDQVNPNPKVFGINQLPANGEMVVIAAGEKDVMALYTIGIPAICFNSETTSLEPKVIKALKKKFKEIVLLYDRDNTGFDKSSQFSKEFKIPSAILPAGTYDKDVTDFLAAKGSKEQIELCLKRGIAKYYRSLNSFKAGELEKMKYEDLDYIIPGILSSDSLCALVGGSDSGKSLLTLQFAISYVISKDFIGHTVNGGKKVLYLSFEDSNGTLAGRFQRLCSKLSKEEIALVKENLFFKNQRDNFVLQILDHLKRNPDTGVIIVDTFAEIASGRDINNSGEVRDVLKPLQEICFQNQLAIITIHHIGKAPEKEDKMSKTGIVGSQSFEAAMRVVIQMNKSKNQFRLGITKGNDIVESKKAPNSTISLTHDLESLWFFKTIAIKSVSVSKGTKQAKKADWKQIFEDEKELRYGVILQRLIESGFTETPAETLISKELKEHKISKGLYRNPTLPVAEVGEDDEDDHFEL